jgi:hypothetical protein
VKSQDGMVEERGRYKEHGAGRTGDIKQGRTEEQSRKHEKKKTRKRARGSMKPSSFVLSSFRVFVVGGLLLFILSAVFCILLLTDNGELDGGI